MAVNTRRVRLFFASPGDLAAERQELRRRLREFNSGFGEGARIEFIPFGWEDAPSTVGPRPQSVINRFVDECDVFLLALHRRWGQPAPDSDFSSYTEEEFNRALDRFNRDGHSPRIFVFFKSVDALSLADPGAQLTKVLEFKRELETSRRVLYKTYDSIDDFWRLLDQHLRSLAVDELPDPRIVTPLTLPGDILDRVRTAEARAERLALSMALEAARHSHEGRLEEARRCFAVALGGPAPLDVLSLAFSFYLQVGDTDEADIVGRRWRLETLGSSTERAACSAELAKLYVLRGDWEKAEQLIREALVVYESTNDRSAVVRCLVDLGSVAQNRGDLADAQELYLEGIDRGKQLDEHHAVAMAHSSLGLIARIRGQAENARMHWMEARSFFARVDAKRELGYLDNLISGLPPEGAREHGGNQH
jgi:tetratricopeptide (TPR) repeat protein